MYGTAYLPTYYTILRIVRYCDSMMYIHLYIHTSVYLRIYIYICGGRAPGSVRVAGGGRRSAGDCAAGESAASGATSAIGYFRLFEKIYSVKRVIRMRNTIYRFLGSFWEEGSYFEKL